MMLAKVQVAIVIGAWSVVWILIGVKIILAPGRWSLGFTGVSFFVGAIAILFPLPLVQTRAGASSRPSPRSCSSRSSWGSWP